jgi:hypothetical protein
VDRLGEDMSEAPARKIIVELDVSNCDESMEPERIKGISVTYYNVGEGMDWTEDMPFRVLKVIRA